MNDISISKLRKVPISQRLDLIQCLNPKECHSECLFLLRILSEENFIRENLVNKTLQILFGNHIKHSFDSYDISNIILFKCVDLLYFIKEIFVPYVLTQNIGQDNLVAIIEKIIITKLNHKNIKEVSILLEDLFIKYDTGSEKIYSTCYLLESVLIINKIKILDHLISKKNTDVVMGYLSQVKHNYPVNSIIRIKIENILNIYDIV